MASSHIITVLNGGVGFAPIPAAGAPLDLATALCVCPQIASATISASPNTTDVSATWCTPASSKAVASSFELAFDGLQDWGRDDGTLSFSEWLFENDGGEAIAVLYLENGKQVKALGRVSVSAGDFGGPGGEALGFSGTMPMADYPDVYKSDGTVLKHGAAGDATVKIPVTGALDCGATTAGAAGPPTGVTSGTPGSWTGGDAAGEPSTLTAAKALVSAAPGNGFIVPAGAWATGEYVLAGATHIHWDNTASNFATGDVS